MLSQISFSGACTGLILTLSLLDIAGAVTIPVHSEPTPKPAIAVKLSKNASADGPSVIESLVQKAQSSSKKTKRDVSFSVKPLFRNLTPERLAEMIKKAEETTPSYKAPDFGAWYQVVFDTEAQDDDDELYELIKSLAENEEVASGQTLIATVTPPSVDPSDDPRVPEQGYLTAADTGINAKYAWGFPGGDGAGTTIIDVEMGWFLEHEDLVGAGITQLAGHNPNRYGAYWPHGTAVLGEILMVDNAVGGVGIAPSAQGHVVGIARGEGADFRESIPEAILDAASFLEFGDVILTEVQILDANGNYYPIEISDAEFEAIQLATAMGITVVEPAGNGGVDLDLPILRNGDTVARSLLNPSSPEFRESGALMVTMASSTTPHSKLPLTNYGNRINAYAWGQNILTTYTTSSFPYQSTYELFDGTSGAAPIIAGAALSIQGMVFANTGSKLSPSELRSLITVGGTPSANGASDRMSLMPNLKALIDGGYLN